MLGDLTPLEAFADRFQNEPIPDHSRTVMHLCALDWAICGMGARDDPIAASMSVHATRAGAGRGSVFFGKASDRLPARAAALINGTISHAQDFDDTHFAHIGHVSTVVLPAALAVAEDQDRDFDSFITAARIGAEVACRVGLWLGRSHYQAGWHQTATAGAYGAAVAAAFLMGAPVSQSILNVAGLATGLKAQFGSAMKPVNAGMAAAHGVEAAQLAMAGMCGSTEVLAAVLATQAGAGNRSAFDGLGRDWVFDSVSHKYHACCHGTHAMIEALKTLLPLDPDQVERIDVTTHPRWMTVCNKPNPASWLEGKFSYRFLAALTLQGDTTMSPAPEGYFPLTNRTRALMDRVHVGASERVSETATRIDVSLKSGEARVATHDLAQPDPLDSRLLKLTEKGAGLVSRPTTAQIWEAICARDLPAFTATLRQ